MEPLRERQKRRAREDLLAAAARLFRENGYAETTTTEIAEAAGVSRRTLFRYFPSKTELALAFEDDQMRRLVELVTARASTGRVVATLVESLLEIVDAWEPGSDDEAQPVESQRLTDGDDALHLAYLRREEVRNEELVRVFADQLTLDDRDVMRVQLWVRFVNAAIHVSLDQCGRARDAGSDTPAGAIFRDVLDAAGLLAWDARHDVAPRAPAP